MPQGFPANTMCNHIYSYSLCTALTAHLNWFFAKWDSLLTNKHNNNIASQAVVCYCVVRWRQLHDYCITIPCVMTWPTTYGVFEDAEDGERRHQASADETTAQCSLPVTCWSRKQRFTSDVRKSCNTPNVTKQESFSFKIVIFVSWQNQYGLFLCLIISSVDIRNTDSLYFPKYCSSVSGA